MLVALEASRPDRTRDLSLEQPSNMWDMSSTFDVSRPDRSRDSSLEQPLNM